MKNCSKRSSGDNESSFKNPFEKLSRPVQERWKTFFRILLSSKYSYYTQISFDNPTEKNSPICRKNPVEIPKKVKLFVLFQKFWHFQENFRRICGLLFWNPWTIKLARSPFSCWKNENGELFLLFNNFLKMLFRGPRIQFWQPCRFFAAKNWNFFCWSSKIRKKLQFLLTKIFLLKKFLWARRKPSWQPF